MFQGDRRQTCGQPGALFSLYKRLFERARQSGQCIYLCRRSLIEIEIAGGGERKRMFDTVQTGMNQ